MIRIRKSTERGHLNHGRLDTYHTFSFGSYYDPNQMGFRALRVINEDWVAPGEGFGTHGHADMEIVTLVLEGSLAHKDSLGSGSSLTPGEFQRMTAGTGITHSEFNPSPTEPVHLYQIWLMPESKGLTPSYEQKAFPDLGQTNQLRLVASPGAEGGALAVKQDARIFLGTLEPAREVHHPIAPNRHAWLQVLRGSITLNGSSMTAGDGAAVSDESALAIRSDGETEVMLFDLA